MTVIYVDTLFLLNTIIDYLLLLASAKIAGEILYRLRFFFGAIFGGVYAVAIFLPGMQFLSAWPCRVSAAVLMLLIAFSGSRRLLRQTFIFFALSCAFGGGIFLISQLGGTAITLGRGVFYSYMDIKMVLLSAAGCYLLLTLVFKKWGRQTKSEGTLLDVSIQLFGKRCKLTAFSDTGNSLIDPISGKPVLVVDGGFLIDHFPTELQLSTAELRDAASAMGQINAAWAEARARLLSYRSVGVEHGMLLAIRSDVVIVDGKEFPGMLLALSPTSVSDGGSYHALIGRID